MFKNRIGIIIVLYLCCLQLPLKGNEVSQLEKNLLNHSFPKEITLGIERVDIQGFNDNWDTNHHPFFVHAIPKCGTHFIQKVIQLMTNQSTLVGCVMQSDLNRAFLHNCILRTFQPYHSSSIKLAKGLYHQVIAMIRDPRDALVSHVFYMRSFQGRGDKRDFFTVGAEFDLIPLEQQITSLIVGNNYAPSYIAFYQSMIGWALDPYTLTVKYEDLAEQQDRSIRRRTIRAIARHINLRLTPEHLNYILANMAAGHTNQMQDGKVFQRATTGNWKTFLTEEHKQLLKERIGQELILLGYEKDLNW